MEIGAAIVVCFLVVVALGAIGTGLEILYDRGIQKGRLEVQQTAVDRNLGYWDVWQGRNVFYWGEKKTKE